MQSWSTFFKREKNLFTKWKVNYYITYQRRPSRPTHCLRWGHPPLSCLCCSVVTTWWCGQSIQSVIVWSVLVWTVGYSVDIIVWLVSVWSGSPCKHCPLSGDCNLTLAYLPFVGQQAGSQVWVQSVSDWPQMGQIWCLFISDFNTFRFILSHLGPIWHTLVLTRHACMRWMSHRPSCKQERQTSPCCEAGDCYSFCRLYDVVYILLFYIFIF